MQNWTTIPEELYNNIKVYDTVTPLIYGKQGNDNNVVAWVNNYHGARVFSTTLGHNNETVGDARYLDLVTRGLLWAVDKLNDDYLKPAARVYTPVAANGKKVLVPINLALHKPATASATQGGHSPADAVDGDYDSLWCAPDNGNNYWWQVDLQKPQEIAGCRIVWEHGRAVLTNISLTGSAGRPNLENFGRRKIPKKTDPSTTSINSPPATCRYVRVTVTNALRRFVGELFRSGSLRWARKWFRQTAVAGD